MGRSSPLSMPVLAALVLIPFALAFAFAIVGWADEAAQPRHLGLGWAGLGAGFRYWTDGPWGLQVGGLISGHSEEQEENYWRERHLSGGANLMYRLTSPGEAPFIYLSLSLGGEYRLRESRFCDEGGCHPNRSEEATYGAMLLGGAEFLLLGRFGVSAEVGIRLAAADNELTLGPGFGIAILFYLF